MSENLIKEKVDILSLEKAELAEKLSEYAMPKFRAKQIFDWLHKKCVNSFDEMTNLSKSDREKLSESFYIPQVTIKDVQISKLDGTRKYLFLMEDGAMIESVWMSYHHGNSVCVSSQVGCRMGCTFCASTLGGLERNLSTGEILAQVYKIANETGKRVSNVVIMGSGEPMDNYENVVPFIRLLSDPDGYGMSQRNITLSTCGLAPNIRRLADEQLTITLALSLHAPNDELRKTMMPIANAYSLKEVIDSCKYYFEKTGRRLTFEYSLVKGVNDTPEIARELCKLIGGLGGHVNLIPVNPIMERGMKQTEGPQVIAFKNILEKNRINATIRREMGRDIDGACGQLRKRHLEAKE